MEDILKQLVRTAMLEKVAAVQELTNGMQLLAYPLAAGVLVALGYAAGAAGAISSAELLRRRSDNLKLYAPWLPAMFADGSLYIVRRLTEADPDANVPPLSMDELMTAVELLA
jgi:hypothetical protein